MGYKDLIGQTLPLIPMLCWELRPLRMILLTVRLDIFIAHLFQCRMCNANLAVTILMYQISVMVELAYILIEHFSVFIFYEWRI